MTLDLKALKIWWLQWQVDHPKLAHLVVIVESAAVGAFVDVVTNGVDFSEQGLKHAATIIGTAVVVAVRNYVKDNAKNLKQQLEVKPEVPGA